MSGIAGNACSLGAFGASTVGEFRSNTGNTPKELPLPPEGIERGFALSSWNSITCCGPGLSVGGGGVPPFLAPVGPFLLCNCNICCNADNFLFGADCRGPEAGPEVIFVCCTF